MIDLWPHQIKAGKLLLNREISALWWEPRCGKTLTALEGSKDGDRLIICPNSVKGVWANDINLYEDSDTYIWSNKKCPNRPRNCIVNYETLWRTDLLDFGWDSIIFDESQRLANFRTKLFEYIYLHLQELNSARTILLSGTPCPEGYQQIISQTIVATGTYKNFSDPWEAIRDGWIYDDEQRKWKPQFGTNREAKKIMHSYGMAMTQKEAGIDTKKLYRIISIELGKHEEKLWAQFMEKEPSGSQLGLYAQSCASGRNIEGITTSSSKLDAAVEYAIELNQPCVILAFFTSSIKYIAKKFEEKRMAVATISGEDKDSSYRDSVIQKFNQGSLYALVAQVATVKVGLNLSHSNTLIFAENSFSGEARIQAEERCTVRGKNAVEIIDFTSTSSIPFLGEIDLAVRSAVKEKKDFNANSLYVTRRK